MTEQYCRDNTDALWAIKTTRQLDTHINDADNAAAPLDNFPENQKLNDEWKGASIALAPCYPPEPIAVHVQWEVELYAASRLGVADCCHTHVVLKYIVQISLLETVHRGTASTGG